jgi:hypothetical protein
MKIAIDFDGTCVTHDYPRIGIDIGAVPVLKKLIEAGHSLILFTMRSGKYLDEAVDWFKENGIPLYGIQKDPTQQVWTSSPKAYAELYIDDAALGCPLFHIENQAARPFVNWQQVEHLLHKNGILK